IKRKRRLQTIVLPGTRQRRKRSCRHPGNKTPERCAPNDRKRCRIRGRSQFGSGIPCTPLRRSRNAASSMEYLRSGWRAAKELRLLSSLEVRTPCRGSAIHEGLRRNPPKFGASAAQAKETRGLRRDSLCSSRNSVLATFGHVT